MAVFTFLEHFDFSGKIIKPFVHMKAVEWEVVKKRYSSDLPKC